MCVNISLVHEAVKNAVAKKDTGQLQKNEIFIQSGKLRQNSYVNCVR